MKKLIAVCLTSTMLYSTAVNATNCFTKTDDSSISPTGMRFIQDTNCPATNTPSNYAAFPQTICDAANILPAETSTWYSGSVQQTIWANRWNGGHNQKPNPTNPAVNVSGTRCWLQYSSVAIADAATLAGISASVGFPAHDASGYGYLDITEAAGIPDSGVHTFSDFQTNAGTLCNQTVNSYLVATDVVVLPSAYLANVPRIPKDGIKLDWEVQDTRSTSQTTASVTTAASIIHAKGYNFTFYTNPLVANQVGSAEEPYNGIVGYPASGENTDTIMGEADYTSLLLWSGNNYGETIETMLSNELGQFQSPNYSKLYIVLDLQSATSDVQSVKSTATSLGLAGFEIWPDGITLGGGDCTLQSNQNIGYASGVY